MVLQLKVGQLNVNKIHTPNGMLLINLINIYNTIINFFHNAQGRRVLEF